ncbi:MAG TPA: glycosyltransferase, partial [Acidimicrobiales bacterium]|nr:glycosyltransferase [Acidimicrobiales bacterium]
MRHRIGVITDDALTAAMAGPAIRAWEIAGALAPEHDARLLTTSNLCELSSPSFEMRQGSRQAVRELESWADVLVVEGGVMGRHRVLRSTSKIVVVDLYDPFHLEQLELFRDNDAAERWASVSSATSQLNAQLARGDFFICASAKQRHFWLGQLAAVGRLNPPNYDEDETLTSLIDVAPFGLPAQPPTHTEAVLKGVVPGIGPEDEVILWGGGIYNWFDPLTLIRAIDALRTRRPAVRLFFLGLAHPNPEVPRMRMAMEARRLAGELGLVGTHVFFNEGWVPYARRQSYLLEADIGVSTHLDHLETAFSFRTRVLDYIWAALPVVTTEGDALADLVSSEGLGLTVPPSDANALEEALFLLLSDRASR